MRKLLLAAGAIVGISANGAVSAAALRPILSHSGHYARFSIHSDKAQTLYDQTGNASGIGIVSQNFEEQYDVYDNQSADDFIVPKGGGWKVTEVDVTGTTFNGSGRADSENVIFYRDKKNLPGKVIAKFNAVTGEQDGEGTFFIDLGKGVKLKPGHYWLSIQANEDFLTDGEWGWQAREDVVNAPSVWRNPGDGFETGCIDWTVQTICIPDGQGDQMFILKGKVLK